MKSRLSFCLLIPFIGCFTSSQAQSLRVIDSMGNILTNDTIFVQASVSDYDIQVPAGVENISGSDLSVNITRFEEDVLPNTSSFFCWGTCTGVMTSGQYPTLTPSGSVMMTAGEIVPGNGDGFLFHYDPNYQVGTSLFKITFFDVNDTLDNTSVYISITSSEDNVSIQEQDDRLLTLYPNPTERFVSIQFPTNVQPVLVRIVNVYGQEVASYQSPAGTLTIEIKEGPGVYFLELLMSDDRRAVKKLIKE